MLLPQLLVEVPHAEIEVSLLVQPQHLLGGLHRNPVNAPLAPPLIEQPVVAELLISLPNPAHRPVADAGDLGRRQPRDLLGHRLQNHIL